jgi:hypothetical protein
VQQQHGRIRSRPQRKMSFKPENRRWGEQKNVRCWDDKAWRHCRSYRQGDKIKTPESLSAQKVTIFFASSSCDFQVKGTLQ